MNSAAIHPDDGNSGLLKTDKTVIVFQGPASAQPLAAESIPVCRPLLPRSDRLLRYLEVIDGTRQYSNHGGLVLALQTRLAAMAGGQAHVAVAASGTAALAGAILATAGRADSRRPLCLVPAYTFIGTVSAIEQCGFQPYFVDVDPETWLLDPERCRSHPLRSRVGLVVPVAPYGRPVPQTPWQAFRDVTGIEVVVDGAAAVESLVARPELYIGDIPVVASFHATKVFCTAEGGAVFCSDVHVWRAAIEALNFGYNLDRVSGRPSINGKMSEYHAAVGLAELDGWGDKTARYAEVVRWYREIGTGLSSHLHLAPAVASNYALVETTGAESSHRLMLALREAGIGCRRWYGAGVHRQPYCLQFGRDDLQYSENLANRLVGLPMATDLKMDEIDQVLEVVRMCENRVIHQ